jgi:CDP-glycerol glycerophosphotransferase
VPKLSVIVPFASAEPHLAECLGSVAAQTLTDFEALLVPVAADPDAPAEAAEEDDTADEGTDVADDDAVAVARSFAEGDPRFRLLDPAAGIGDARDAGARAAAGEYLTFLTASDRVPAYGYARMVTGLDDSGSDFATGNVFRFNELGARRSPWYARMFAANAVGTHISAMDALVRDRLVGNKVWRNSFWAGAGIAFGGDDAAESLLMSRAHFTARTVDTHAAPIYIWRDAPPGSVTGLTPADVTTVFGQVTELGAYLAANRPPAEQRLWRDTALRTDLWRLLTRLDEADEAARARFLDLAVPYLSVIDPEIFNDLPVLRRLDWYLVARRMMPQLEEMLTFQKSVELKRARAVRHGLRYYAAYPFLDDPAAGVPRRVYRLDEELSVRQKTESIGWSADGNLVISGRAGIRFLRSGRRWQQQMVAFLIDPATRRRTPLPIRVRRAAEFRLPDSPKAARHDWGGFEITIDPEKLRTDGQWRDARWQVELMIVNRGLVRRRLIGSPVAGAPRRPEYREVTPGTWIRPDWSDNDLVLDVERLPFEVTGHSMDGGDLVLTGPSATATETRALRVTWRDGAVGGEWPVVIDGREFSVRIDAARLLADAEVADTLYNQGAHALRWDVATVRRDGTTRNVVLSESRGEGRYAVGERRVAVQRTHTGHLRLETGLPAPVVASAAWKGATLSLDVHFETPDGCRPELVLKARGRNEEHLFPLERVGDTADRLTAAFDPPAVRSHAGVLPLPSGTYELLIRASRPDTDADPGSDARGQLDHDFLRHLPLGHEAGHRTFTLDSSGYDVPVLTVTGDLRPEERGTYAQQQLREVAYPAMRQRPVERRIYFDSFTGRQFSDSPRAIYEELRRRGVAYPAGWLARDGQVALPEDLELVRHTGEPYYDWLARSAYIVSNSRLPQWFARREGQTVLQTWHGSMLKRIGFDIEKIRGKSRDYHEKLAHEVAQWDYLVSPSPWATPILRQAFRFDGEILETGYPRNDIFFAPNRDEIAARTRAALGLPADKKVIMYAPTWRDNKFYSRGKYKLDLQLDLKRAYDRLGDDYVLLVRRHPWVVDRVPRAGREFVFDVSTYPEIMDLFLITDVLITDYSSLMFDFANTGRPMLFFTYDMADYRDNLRGFYFDFEETAPGPLLPTSDDVIEAVGDIDAVAAAHAARYEAFTTRFCPLDDGKAAARVVDRALANLK